MHRLMRFYNQNRKDIWKVIGVSLAIVVILQVLNYRAEKRNKEKEQQQNISNNTSSTIKYNNLNLKNQKSILLEEELSQDKKDSVKIIDDFFSYCSQQKLQEAYDLLTEECKQEMYSSVQNFEEMYYQNILNGEKKDISVENWIGNIYKVTINEDFLSSGKYSTENTIQDYITIKDNKLNINGYIGRTEPNKEKEKENIKIKILQKDMYIDYTIYTFEITNNSKRTILLDSLNNIDTMYIEDSNQVKYSAYTHELSIGQLVVNEGEKKQIKIKYYSKFSSDKNNKKIIFSKVILDYDLGIDSNYSKFTIEL